MDREERLRRRRERDRQRRAQETAGEREARLASERTCTSSHLANALHMRKRDKTQKRPLPKGRGGWSRILFRARLP